MSLLLLLLLLGLPLILSLFIGGISVDDNTSIILPKKLLQKSHSSFHSLLTGHFVTGLAFIVEHTGNIGVEAPRLEDLDRRQFITHSNRVMQNAIPFKVDIVQIDLHLDQVVEDED